MKYTSSPLAPRQRAAARSPAPLKFAAWLPLAKITDDPAGDLIADLRRDPNRPGNFTSKESLKRYLSPKACDGAMNAIPEVWRRYTQWREARELEQHHNPNWLECNNPTCRDVP